MNQNIIFQQADTDMNIINNNPYRILGVFANSRRQEILANKGRATAFLKVGRPVDFPLDLNGILPPISRTVDIMDKAEAHLALAKEQLKYAQFWFLKMTPMDDVAFNYLFAGNINEAMTIWSKQDNLSSLQNRMICCVLQSSLPVALTEQLYEKYGSVYIEKVFPTSTLKMDSTELIHQYIDTYGAEVGMTSLVATLMKYSKHDDWKNYSIRKTVEPLINQISTEVEKVKKIDHNNSNARIEAARRLISSTKNQLDQLKAILGANAPQYAMIADKLGLEILQCGIDYFNNSDDDDVPHTAMKMQRYAQSIVVGNLAKQRCEENVKILQKIIDELPPKEVMAEDKAIKSELSKFVRLPDKISYAVNLLNNTKPHLKSIRKKLNSTNEYYLRISTQIVRNALHNIVEEVNEVQSDPQIAVRMQLGLGLDSTSLSIIKNVVREAWKATLMMDELDLEPQFKSSYENNRSTLKTMCNDLGISTYSSSGTTIPHSVPVSGSGTSTSSTKGPVTQSRHSTVYERQYGNDSAEESLWEYIKSPKSSRLEAATIVTILGGFIGYLIYYNNPETIAVDEKWSCILWGTGIGAISWFCIFVDNDTRSFDTRSFGNGGCAGALLLIALFIFYWIYKFIRLAIDGFKEL